MEKDGWQYNGMQAVPQEGNAKPIDIDEDVISFSHLPPLRYEHDGRYDNTGRPRGALSKLSHLMVCVGEVDRFSVGLAQPFLR
jgi:hypothetical protein